MVAASGDSDHMRERLVVFLTYAPTQHHLSEGRRQLKVSMAKLPSLTGSTGVDKAGVGESKGMVLPERELDDPLFEVAEAEDRRS